MTFTFFVAYLGYTERKNILENSLSKKTNRFCKYANIQSQICFECKGNRKYLKATPLAYVDYLGLKFDKNKAKLGILDIYYNTIQYNTRSLLKQVSNSLKQVLKSFIRQ